MCTSSNDNHVAFFFGKRVPILLRTQYGSVAAFPIIPERHYRARFLYETRRTSPARERFDVCSDPPLDHFHTNRALQEFTC